MSQFFTIKDVCFLFGTVCSFIRKFTKAIYKVANIPT